MRENTRRQYLIRTGAAIGGAAMLAGCSGDESSQSPGSQSDSEGSATSSEESTDEPEGSATSSEESTDEPEESATSSGESTIEWWHAMGGQRGQVLEQMVDDFNDQSDSVTVEPVYKGNYTETVNAAISAVRAGEAPALVQVLNPTSKLVKDSGQFEAMESFIGDQVDWSRFYDTMVDYYSWDGTVWALPFNDSNPVLYYNKDMFRDAGLDPEDPPFSLAEVRQAAETLVNEGVAETGLTFKNSSWYIEQWFAIQNQVLVNEENGRAGDADKFFIDVEDSELVHNWISEMKEDGLFTVSGTGRGGGADESAIQVFINQDAGMMIQTIGDVVNIKESAEENGFEFGVSEYPAPDGKKTGHVIGGGGVWATKDLSDAKKDAVIEFVSWLSEPEQQASWHRNTGYFPTTEDATELLEDDGWFEENPNVRVAFDQLQQTEHTPATSGFQVGPAMEIRSIIEDGVISMLSGNDVQETLAETKNEGDNLLQDYIESK